MCVRYLAECTTKQRDITIAGVKEEKKEAAEKRSTSTTSNMSLKLIALDLDGTTLNSNHQISEKMLSTIRRLSNRGIVVMIATGRSIISTIDYALQLNLSVPVPVSVFNGSVGFMVTGKSMEGGERKELLYSNPIPIPMCRELIDFASKYNWVVQYYNAETGEVSCCPKSDDHIKLLKKYEELTGKKQTYLESFDQILESYGSAKLIILSPDCDDLISKAKEELTQGSWHFFKGSDYFCEFLHANMSKGEGLKSMTKKLGISLDQVVAFGDGNNDKEFIEYAGLGVAMKNACELPKSVANEITQFTNDEDGVAHHLEQLESQGRFKAGPQE